MPQNEAWLSAESNQSNNNRVLLETTVSKNFELMSRAGLSLRPNPGEVPPAMSIEVPRERPGTRPGGTGDRRRNGCGRSPS